MGSPIPLVISFRHGHRGTRHALRADVPRKGNEYDSSNYGVVCGGGSGRPAGLRGAVSLVAGVQGTRTLKHLSFPPSQTLYKVD